MSEEIFRGFIAAKIDSNKKIESFIDKLKSSDAKIKTVEPNNLHITLKFLGDTPASKQDDIVSALKKACDGISSFDVSVEGVGVFPKREYVKVVWIGLGREAKKLEMLASHIETQMQSCGFAGEKRKFSSHVTVGRVKFVKDKSSFLGLIDGYSDVFFSNQRVSDILFMKSTLTPNGPIYEIVKKIPLK